MIPRFKRIKKSQNIFFSILLLNLFLVVIGFLILSNWRINQKRAELTAKIEALKKEIEVLEAKNLALNEEISQTKKESYWEERIRQQGYKKTGEEQVIVLPPKKEEVKEEKSFLQSKNWLEWLKSKLRD